MTIKITDHLSPSGHDNPAALAVNLTGRVRAIQAEIDKAVRALDNGEPLGTFFALAEVHAMAGAACRTVNAYSTKAQG